MKKKIELKNVKKIFRTPNDSVLALDNLNLTVYEGEFVCIVGPSGCGKTTLLRILAGLSKQTEGLVLVYSRDPDKPLNSMVFQGDSLFPWMTVKANVAYGLTMRGVSKKKREKIAEHFIKKMSLDKFMNAFPHQLSGGMRQRVNVARAFANDPEILLMDEPFASLDEQNRIILQQQLLKIWEESHKTTVFITHSIDEAILLGDRVLVMTAQPGRLKADIKISLNRPRELSGIRSNPAFISLYEKIWQLLREEVLKAKN
mgnify:CR=1 FL=1